jgi:ubiquinone/menaquinone biosynthesis C-methylase UbiE
MHFLGKIIYSTFSSRKHIEALQQNIRDIEWASIAEYIPEKSKFLDVGCGAGYAMQSAQEEKFCSTTGIDPDPGAHGVGRYENSRIRKEFKIIQGFSENLPFEDETFDVVYSSHVLEHVNDEGKTLSEINRVLKKSGVLIIGMPTSTMAIVNLFSQFIFTTHIKIYEFFRFIHKKGHLKRFISIIRITSHSAPKASSIWYDIVNYRNKRWENLISRDFKIEKTIFPLLYPYPDYIQLFKPRKMKKLGSSIFFICIKK